MDSHKKCELQAPHFSLPFLLFFAFVFVFVSVFISSIFLRVVTYLLRRHFLLRVDG